MDEAASSCEGKSCWFCSRLPMPMKLTIEAAFLAAILAGAMATAVDQTGKSSVWVAAGAPLVAAVSVR